MPLTAYDLRHHPEQSYPLLYAYLHRHAQRHLGPLKYDAFEVDTVIGHVVEQLVRLGLFGGGDAQPLTALDGLTDAQFYAFLSRSIRNKAIDRLRKRRLPVSTVSQLDAPGDSDDDNSTMEDAVTSVWGSTPFATPEEITLHLASQRDLRNLLKHCILVLRAAPNQLQAVIEELQAIGADELLSLVNEELHLASSPSTERNPHISQHRDHAHRKLRLCLQQKSSNLTVTVALRLTEYTTFVVHEDDYSVDIQTLARDDLSCADVRVALQELVAEGLLNWHDDNTVFISRAQIKRLSRFYKEE
jgi:hypothetical protein